MVHTYFTSEPVGSNTEVSLCNTNGSTWVTSIILFAGKRGMFENEQRILRRQKTNCEQHLPIFSLIGKAFDAAGNLDQPQLNFSRERHHWLNSQVWLSMRHLEQWNKSHLNFKSRALFSRDHRLGERIVDNLLILRIPFYFPPHPSGDSGKMTSRQCAMMTKDIRDRSTPTNHRFKKVCNVVSHGPVVIDLFNRVIR